MDDLSGAVQIAQLIVTAVMIPPVWIVWKMVTNHMRHDISDIKETLGSLPCKETKCSPGSRIR